MTASQTSFASSALPYGLTPPAFRFRALAALAGRAPLGGAREVALATYLLARLVDDCLPYRELLADARAERSAAARVWLSNIALPPTVRASLTKLADATAGDPTDVAPAMANVVSVVDSYLDDAARVEVDRLARAIRK